MYSIPTIDEFEKLIAVSKSLETGKSQLAEMRFIDICIDMMEIDYTNSNQKILIQNPLNGAELIYLYNKFKEYHTHDTIMNILFACTNHTFYFKTLKHQNGFKNIFNVSFEQFDCANESFDVVIRCTPGNNTDFVKGFDVLKKGGKLLYSHLAEIVLNKKERTRDEDEDRNLFKQIVNEYEAKIRLFNGKREFKSTFDTLIATTIITKTENKKIKVRYNQFDTNNLNWIELTSTNDLWIHGNQLVSKIFKSFNEKTKSNPKIFNRLYKNLKKENTNLFSKYKWWVSPNLIAGVIFSKGYYSFLTIEQSVNPKSMICKSEDLQIKKKINDMFHFGFSTKKEALNFIKLLQTKFMRFYLSMYKVDGNLNRNETRNLPEFDLSKEWDDDMINNYLDIPDNYRIFIDNFNLIK